LFVDFSHFDVVVFVTVYKSRYWFKFLFCIF
jgi:hypothetical protein